MKNTTCIPIAIYLLSLFTIVTVVLPKGVTATELKTFTTDGCSLFLDGTLEYKDLWLGCCIDHDKKYWKGGTYKERQKADIELKECVTNVGDPAIAELMLRGVQVGGSPYWPTRFRWGYGWPYLRGYKAITVEEYVLIKSMLNEKLSPQQ